MDSGKTLLSSVERVLMPSAELSALVEQKREQVRARHPRATPVAVERETAKVLISHYTRRAALLGGAAGMVSMVPGVHWGALIAGGLMMDASLLLKFEVEMTLALSHLHGFDIEDPTERQLGFFLASVATHDQHAKRSFLADVLAVEREAVWKYTPRRVGKMLVDVLATIALMRAGRQFMRLIPLVGPTVGTAMNGLLTKRVGEDCNAQLETRRRLLGRVKQAPARGVAPAARKAVGGKPARVASPRRSGVRASAR